MVSEENNQEMSVDEILSSIKEVISNDKVSNDIEDEDEFLDTKVCLNRKTITQNPIACQLYFLTSL